ncbi:MAG TPA: MFS transporter [Solirubrobacteraceae bacterium]|nr:MFS transporter [Solirubrobacteraceae bacterium]HUB74947.1 MFS transporter [Solirubrobacteraceae bacterium]
MNSTITPTPNRTAQRAALGVAMLGFFVVALDAQIVNVALPTIRQHLGGGLAGLQWVVTGYTLMFSALLLFGGTLSDRVGARRAYGVGMMLFVAASFVCGIAPTLGTLIAGRIVQGFGAAMITPTSLALIREAYDDDAARGRAIAYWALGGSVAAAAGPVLGGLLTQIDWRLIFDVNIPVGAAALLVLTRVAESPRRERRFDWTGQIAAVLALGGLTFGIIEGGRLGYGATPVLAAFVIAAASAVAFVVAQAKGRQPMVPLGLFSSRAMSTGLSIAAITMAAFYGVVFVQSLYFQQQRGQSALITGLLFLPMTGMVAALNPLVARVMASRGLLPTTIAGIVVMAAGLGALCLLPAGAPVWLASLSMVPVGVGGSFTVPPLTALVMGQIPAERAGTASGVLNTARQMGGSLGVAVFGAVIATQASFISGLRLDFGITALLLIGAAGAALTLRPSEQANTKLATTERTPCNT